MSESSKPRIGPLGVTATDIPEYIDRRNLTGMRSLPGVQVQSETRDDIRALGLAMKRFGYLGDTPIPAVMMDIEAARYAMEVGIAALQGLIEAEQRAASGESLPDDDDDDESDDDE